MVHGRRPRAKGELLAEVTAVEGEGDADSGPEFAEPGFVPGDFGFKCGERARAEGLFAVVADAGAAVEVVGVAEAADEGGIAGG